MEENQKNEQQSTTAVSKRDNSLLIKGKVNDFSDFTSVEQMLQFGEQLKASGLTPLKKAEDIMAAMLMGRELGFGVMASVNNIYPINGRATSGVHIITGLLLRAGVTYKVLEDYTPLYTYADMSKNVYGEDEVTKRKDIFQIVTSQTPATEIDRSRISVIKFGNIADYRTTVEFYRQLRKTDGALVNMTIKISRTIKDYAHLLEKDNWKTNPKGMLFNRILATGGRAIADDVLLGLYLTEELSSEPENITPVVETSNIEVFETVVQEAGVEVKEGGEAAEATN